MAGSIAKGFRITEGIRLGFRAEAFNVFNRGSLQIQNANFGRLLTSGDLLKGRVPILGTRPSL